MPSPTQKTQPTQLKPFFCHFEDEDTLDETLVINWMEPQDDQTTIQREERFLVGSQCLLDDVTDISVVPFEQLEACLRMNCLLAGTGSQGVQIGTGEFWDALVDQGGAEGETKNFQSIVGTAKVDTTTPRNDLGAEGIIWDVDFKRASGSDRRLITTDVNTVSNYKDGLNRYFFASMCVPGWIKKEFPTYDKANINASKRQEIIDVLPTHYFWV